MRWIAKPVEPPPAIREYVLAQTPVGHGLDYPTFAGTRAPGGGTRARQLRLELTHEQYGLCAYTGAAIDSQRFGGLQDHGSRLKFAVHNEHLKPRSVCQQELEAAGKTYGCDLGEDMDHRNIVAALLVSGSGTPNKVAKQDLFGASHRENDPVPVLPTGPDCEIRFAFDISGEIRPANPDDDDAKDTIAALNLQHRVLTGWRRVAIETFIEGIGSLTDAERIVDKTTNPTDGLLPEYSFAIRQAVRRLLP